MMIVIVLYTTAAFYGRMCFFSIYAFDLGRFFSSTTENTFGLLFMMLCQFSFVVAFFVAGLFFFCCGIFWGRIFVVVLDFQMLCAGFSRKKFLEKMVIHL
jgi:hypothetical protein